MWEFVIKHAKYIEWNIPKYANYTDNTAFVGVIVTTRSLQNV